MIKQIIIASVMLASTFTTNAQLQIGASTSIHKSQAYNKQDDSMAIMHRLNTIKSAFAINALYNINDKLALGTELNYFKSGQNYHCDSISISKSLDAQLTLKYLHIPLYLQYNFMKKESKLKIQLQAGAYLNSLLGFTEKEQIIYPTINGNAYKIDYMLKNKQTSGDVYLKTITGGDTMFSATSNYDKLLYNKIDFGIHSAINLSYSTSQKITVFINLFYKYGLSDIEGKELANEKDSKGNVLGTFSIKQQYPYKYSFTSSNQLLRSKTNIVNMGLQIGILYKL
jgi:hypothetical protein